MPDESNTRIPDELDQGGFPEEAYLDAFPDVRGAVQDGIVSSGYDHWARYGRFEIAAGQRPCPDCLNAPAAAAVQPVQATTRKPGRKPPPIKPEIAAQAELASDEARFCEELYLATNPDVADSVAAGNFRSGLAHWQEIGRQEERRGVRPSITMDAYYADERIPDDADFVVETETFDSEGYLYLYPDVRQAVGGRLDEAREHWRKHGRLEGRHGPGVMPYRQWRASVAGVLGKPFGLNIYGPFAATSGLGSAARSIVRAVKSAGIPFELHNFDVSHGPPRVMARDLDRVPTYRVNLIMANADQMSVLTGKYLRGRFDDAYNIAMWAWELAAFRPEWFSAFGPLDEVWTNSEFEVESIAAMSPVPVHKIRLPVEATPTSKQMAREVFGIPQDRLVFLTAFDVGSTSARKNPRMVVEAFGEAFAGSDDVFLVIKFHSSNIDPGVTRDLNRVLRGVDNVLVIADRLPSQEMHQLQSACDVLVSAHRSEGFGLNIAEFMALGKPVIATGYSGNLEFFDETVGFPIDYGLVELEQQAGPYYPGYIWADPSVDSLVEQFKAVRDNPAEAEARGTRARTRMASEFSIERIGEQMRERLLAIGLGAEMPAFVGWLGRSRTIATPPLIAPLSAYSRQALMDLTRIKPILSLVVPVYNVPVHYLDMCIQSVFDQTYPFWELCICDDCSTNPETIAALDRLRGTDPRIRIRRLPVNQGISGASNAAAEMATGEFLLMLDNDDVLAPDALLEVARAFNADPDIEAMYCDEDKWDENSNFIDHFYKPDWSPEHLESVMYVLHMLTIRKKLFLELGGFRDEFSGAQDYDLMLRVSRATSHIHHIAKPLYHWRAIPGSAASVVDAKPYALTAGLRALTEHAIAKYGPGARVEDGLLPGTFRVRRPIRGNPRVSLLILTNNTEIDLPDRGGRFHMVDNLVNSILAKTSYPNYEIVVVDNSKLKPEQKSRFAELGVRVVNYEGSVTPFNYAAKSNFSVRQARTEHLVMLNDDMEVINDDWLTALMEFSQDPEIGVAGGRLLHADNSIQHVGTVIGVNDGTAHVYHSFPGEFIGYNGFTHLIRNYSAMTGACIATRKSVLAQVGGVDENFAVDFNDTDLCLKIVEAGYRIVYTPFCQMYHFESKSAVRSVAAEDEKRRFVNKWRKYMDADPHYNVNLARSRLDYALKEG